MGLHPFERALAASRAKQAAWWPRSPGGCQHPRQRLAATGDFVAGERRYLCNDCGLVMSNQEAKARPFVWSGRWV